MNKPQQPQVCAGRLLVTIPSSQGNGFVAQAQDITTGEVEYTSAPHPTGAGARAEVRLWLAGHRPHKTVGYTGPAAAPAQALGMALVAVAGTAVAVALFVAWPWLLLLPVVVVVLAAVAGSRPQDWEPFRQAVEAQRWVEDQHHGGAE